MCGWGQFKDFVSIFVCLTNWTDLKEDLYQEFIICHVQQLN